jgi:membrane fusion protein, multidrug efflux system
MPRRPELDLRAKHLAQLNTLRDRGHATQREVDRAVADFRVAEARLEMAQEELDLQRLECHRIETQISRRRIQSPIAGIVSQLYREVGESLASNDPRVATIVQLDRLRAKFPLNSMQIERLYPGQTVRVEIQGQQVAAKALVETIAPVMDAKSSTVEVTVAIANEDESLPSGVRCWLVLPSTNPPADSSRTRYTTFQKESTP